jgi:hypothetical protein
MPLFSQWRVYSLTERDARRDELWAARGSSACRISFENWRARAFVFRRLARSRNVLCSVNCQTNRSLLSTTRPRII